MRVRDKMLVVVLAPLLLLSVFGVRAASAGFARAEEASDTSETIELVVSLAEVNRSLASEEVWLAGPRQIENQDRPGLIDTTGLSLQFIDAHRESNRRQTDTSVRELLVAVDDYSTVLMAGEIQLLLDLGDDIELLRTQYQFMSRSDAELFYRRLRLGVASVIERLMGLERSGLGRGIIDLGRAEVAARQEAVNLIATLALGVYDLETDRVIAAAQQEQDRALRTMRNTSPEIALILAPVVSYGASQPGVYEAWLPYRELYAEVTPERVPDVLDGNDIVVAVLAASRVSEELFHVEEQILELMRQRAQVNESEAIRDAVWSVGLLLVVGLGTLILALFVSRSVTRPLERLAAESARLSEGKLGAPDLAIGGSDEIAVLGGVIDATVETFSLLGRQISALAMGDLEAEALSEYLPGDIGRSVRDSVASLAAVTVHLRSSETLATAIVETAADAILVVDERGLTCRANNAAANLTCRSKLELVGMQLDSFLGDIPSSGSEAIELTLQRPDGISVPVLVSVGEAITEEGLFRTVIVRDISVQKQLEEELTRDARHDSLTGLVNRVGVLELIVEMQRLDSAFAVFFVDLDRFKRVNDTLGHQMGDDLLIQIAERIRACMRKEAVVARVGGDEFVVVAPMPSVELAIERGGQLVESIRRPVQLGRRTAFVGASVGIVFEPTGSEVDPEVLIQQADMAMYNAKHYKDTDVEVFDQVLQQRAADRDLMERDLREAIAEDQLEVHYQPIVRLDNREQVGVEALARWDRNGERVSPDEFIGLAENTDLIFSLWERVIGKVCEALAVWQKIRPDFTVSVNVSARQLNAVGLVESVSMALATYEVDPSGLHLEITETSTLQDIADVGLIVAQLKEMGIGVALDDFGTGYSSLTSLLQLPIEAVKIDKSFVKDLRRGSQQAEVVRIFLMLANTVGIDVIAEGIETEAQGELLLELGCELGQGWLFASAMPFERVRVAAIDDRSQTWHSEGST